MTTKRKAALGFTLIELIIVFSLIGLLSSLGIQTFVDYNKKQTLDAAANEIVNALQTARSRALSQVKPTYDTKCDQNTEVLEGYRVSIESSSRRYILYAVCSTGAIISCPGTNCVEIKRNQFPVLDMFVKDTDNDWFQFQVLTGAVTYEVPPSGSGGRYLQIPYAGRTRTITVFPDGRITVQ